jgi:6-phospho-3-hexuloisomerase
MIQTGQTILQEISLGLNKLKARQVDQLLMEIKNANRVFCIGAGRSRIMLGAFCMRLNHLGIEAYVAGNIPCPPALKGDLIIAASGSGTTPSVISVLGRVKEAGARIAVVTASQGRDLTEIADLVVDIEAPNSLINTDNQESRQLMRTLFEQILFILEEALIAVLSENIPVEEIVSRHTNLE